MTLFPTGHLLPRWDWPVGKVEVGAAAFPLTDRGYLSGFEGARTLDMRR